MILGIDYIGGVNYIDTIVNHHPSGAAAGFLCKASGWKNGIHAAEALAAAGRCRVMRIHGLWLDNHRFTHRHIIPALKQARRVQKLAEKYPEIKFYYSPWLEPFVTKSLMVECKRACSNILSRNVKIVAGMHMPRGISEVHNISPPPSKKYIYSFDGADMLNQPVSELKKRHRNSMMFFGWTYACNGLSDWQDNTKRKHRNEWITEKQITQLYRKLKSS